MNAQYLIRLDDACPTMHEDKWNRVENILNNFSIKPIVAVIPDNQDSSLIYSKVNKNFWSKVLSWQENKWIIGLHGYDHKYITKSAGIIPINNDSEFADVPLDTQREKIRKGLAIFKQNNIKPVIWVAPSHSFDEDTLEALTLESDINIISDGISLFPYRKNVFLWLPQQLGRPRKMYNGVWTICLHPNIMSIDDFISLEKFCKINKCYFINNIDDLVVKYGKRTISINDMLYNRYYFFKKYIMGKKIIKNISSNNAIKKIVELLKI